MDVLLARASMRYRHDWCLWRPGEDFGFPGTRATDGCEPPMWVLGIEPTSVLLATVSHLHSLSTSA